MKLPMWARLVVLFGALTLFALQVGAYVFEGRRGDPFLGSLSVGLVGAAAGFVVAGAGPGGKDSEK